MKVCVREAEQRIIKTKSFIKMNAKNLVLLLILFATSTIATDGDEDGDGDGDKSNDNDNSTQELSIKEILSTTIDSINYENDTIQSTQALVTISDSNYNDESTTEETTEGITEQITDKIAQLIESDSESERSTSTECGHTHAETKCGVKCRDGLILPVWQPIDNITWGDRFARGLVYFLVMCYLFLGVSIVSDRFMAAIEKITAIEKEVIVRKPDGQSQIIVVRVWNETVANLTLMALGTSAPEILLSIIEIFSKNFEAGQLGPSTIVGSAAYNMFTIIAICIVVIPNNEVRRIKHLRVFFVTASWSIFAYIWLYLILAFFSPGVVDVWEGIITFLGFPLIVYMAYAADRRMLVYKYLNKGYRINERGVMVAMETMPPKPKEQRSDSVLLDDGTELMSDEFKDLEQIRMEYIRILHELKQKYSGKYSAKATLEMMAQEKLLSSSPKSHAFYRVQAGRKILGGGNVIRRIAERTTSEIKSDLKEVIIPQVDVIDDDLTPQVFFQPNHYTVMENCGSVDIRCVRHGDFSGHVSVDYCTQDGSAEAGSDYISQSGTITFTPGISERFIKIDIIDDDVFELDESFYIQLSNPTNGAVLGTNSLATVTILDDDHSGYFQFEEREHELVETVGIYELKVVRASGARGMVSIPYWTEDATAKGGKAFEPQSGQLIFNNNETE